MVAWITRLSELASNGSSGKQVTSVASMSDGPAIGQMRIDHLAPGDAIIARGAVRRGDGDTVADANFAELGPRLLTLSRERLTVAVRGSCP